MRSKRYLVGFIKPAVMLLAALFLKHGLTHVLELPEELLASAGSLGSILLIAGIAWSIIIILRILKKNLLDRYDFGETDNLKVRKLHTQYGIMEKVAIVIVIIVAVSSALMLFEGIRNIGISLFATAGVAGLVLGLAAQKALGTIFAGLQIAIAQPIRLDDVVIVENEWGWIEEIHLTYVVIRIWDKRRLIVPSTYFLERVFQNWTRTSSDILGTVFIYADYTLPFEAVRKELTRLVEGHPHWDGQVNVLQVTDARERVVEMRALVSCETSPKAWELRVYLREKLLEFIQKEYPQCLPRTRIDIEKSKN